MKTVNPHYRELLHQVLNERKKTNSRYSRETFAKALKVDPRELSKILAGKLSPHYPLAERMALELKLDQEKSKAFFDSVMKDILSRISLIN